MLEDAYVKVLWEKVNMEIRVVVLVYLAVMNLAAFAAFGWDKSKARWDGWRIPEKTLLGLALIGGSVGAWCGMKVFRHKIRKAKFKVGILMILTVQCMGIIAAFKALQ